MPDETTNGRKNSVGKVLEIKGVVIDAVFPGGGLPVIYSALRIEIPGGDGQDSRNLIA
jgi:hypothetical protein